MKALIIFLSLTVPFTAAAEWRWTPWVPTNGAGTFGDARNAAYQYAVQECVSEDLEHNQSTTYGDWDGIDPATGLWMYKSRHYFDCVVPQGYQVPCNSCGRGQDCTRAIAASNAIDNAETYCAQLGLSFDFYAPATEIGGIITPACPVEPHDSTGFSGHGTLDIIYVSGTCD